MPADWEIFFEGLKDEAATLLKGEISSLLVEAMADSEDFTRRQAQRVEHCLCQLADGTITKEQFLRYMLDIKDLIELHSLKMEVVAKVRAQALADGIKGLIIDRLTGLLP